MYWSSRGGETKFTQHGPYYSDGRDAFRRRSAPGPMPTVISHRASKDRTVKIWDTAGRQLLTLRGGDQAIEIAFTYSRAHLRPCFSH
jgi:hypothetical protein